MKVIFDTPGESVRALDAPVGVSLMRVAVENGVQGIVGECGGQLSCATCHVLIPPPWADVVPAKSVDEEELLEMVETGPGSRLGCQVVMSEALAGMRVRVP